MANLTVTVDGETLRRARIRALERGESVNGADLVVRAATTARDHQLSLWEAMAVEATAEAGCTELWTEDLVTGSTLRGVTIVDPFVSR